MSQRVKLESASWVCSDCMVSLGKSIPHGHVATFHDGICDLCDKKKTVTEPRDYRDNWIEQKIKGCFLEIYRGTDNFYAKKYAGEGLQLPFGDTLRAHKLKAIQALANLREWNTAEGLAVRQRLSGLIYCINLK